MIFDHEPEMPRNDRLQGRSGDQGSAYLQAFSPNGRNRALRSNDLQAATTNICFGKPDRQPPAAQPWRLRRRQQMKQPTLRNGLMIGPILRDVCMSEIALWLCHQSLKRLGFSVARASR